jgi:hypothetical protein
MTTVDTDSHMGLTSIDLNRLLLPMVSYEKYAYFQSCTHVHQAGEISQTDL